MGLVWRAVLVVAVFVICGGLIAKLVILHGAAGGAPLPQVRLAGAMAGLFGGGAVASVVLLVLAFWKPSRG